MIIMKNLCRTFLLYFLTTFHAKHLWWQTCDSKLYTVNTTCDRLMRFLFFLCFFFVFGLSRIKVEIIQETKQI